MEITEILNQINDQQDKQYQLNQEDLDECNHFAEITAPNHNSNGRSLAEKKFHIKFGKMGERAFYNILKSLSYSEFFTISNINFVNNLKGDGGIDFTINNNNIDVKTIESRFQRVYFKEAGSWEIISVMSIDKNIGTYIGSLFKNDVLRKKQYDSQKAAYFIYKTEFLNNFNINI